MDRSIIGRTAVLLIVGSLSIQGQAIQTSAVTGKVVDESYAPLEGVLVRLSSPSLQGIRTVASDAKGRFVATFLPPGEYRFELTKAGYQTIQMKQSTGLDQNFQPRFRMAKNVVVVVSAAPPAVDKTDMKTAANYRLDRMELLPVQRDMEDLALLTPSVVRGVGGGVQVRGSMTSSNLTLVDGQNVEDGTIGDRGVNVIDDAIEETEVLTGALPAEYGDVDGGVLNAITRSGSNVFSGQIRWNFSNPAWNASAPMIDRNTVEDHLCKDRTVSLGGYLIKDRLWFFTSMYQEKTGELRTLSADAPGPEAGAGYTAWKDEIRRQLKLTWMINEDHTLVGSYMNSGTDYTKLDYDAGSLASLIPQRNSDELFSLDWRAIWSSHVITELRWGAKKENLAAGSPANPVDITQSPLSCNYYFFNHGPFDGGEDRRDNQTFGMKVSTFFDGHGSHQLDAGLDWRRSTRSARNEISGTGYVFGVSDIDPAHGTAVPDSVWVYHSDEGEATVENRALYLNDKWVFNDGLALQLGLRWEKYRALDESNSELAGASTLSPRLGLKYDFQGNSKWIAGASYARYNGKILDQILMDATHQGNAQEVDYYTLLDPSKSVPYSQIFNLSNYDFSAAGVTYANIPGGNIRLNPNLKPPSVDEYQASLAYSFASTSIGDGYLKTTAVYKNWTNLIDYQIGNHGQATYVIPQSGETIHPYVTYWDNDPNATRNYRALEFDFSTAKEPWQFQGNLTWSRLWGNYEGQDDDAPDRGEGVDAWDITDGRVMFNRNITAPEGYLRGHVPFRVRLMGTYSWDSRLGHTTLGLMYRYDGAARTSATRAIWGSALSSDLPNEGQNAQLTQYLNNSRGTLVGNPSHYFDLSLNHEWALFRVMGTPVRAFVRVVIKNIFNHQQVLHRPQVYASYPNSYLDPWTASDPATFGQLNGACFGEPRTYSLSAGFRF